MFLPTLGDHVDIVTQFHLEFSIVNSKTLPQCSWVSMRCAFIRKLTIEKPWKQTIIRKLTVEKPWKQTLHLNNSKGPKICVPIFIGKIIIDKNFHVETKICIIAQEKKDYIKYNTLLFIM